MTNSPKDLETIENSRDMEHARQLIIADIMALKQLAELKKISVKIECHIMEDGVVKYQLYAHNQRPFRKSTTYGNGDFFQTHWTNKNYDQAFNEAREAIKQAEGDMSIECAPWFDMNVYS